MRNELKKEFLLNSDLINIERIQLKKDASHRQYERIIKSNGDTLIFMDAPPDKEKVIPFINVANFLLKNNLSAPEIILSDVENGFLILEDFGDASYSNVMSSTKKDLYEIDEIVMYNKAIDTLVHLHKVSYDDCDLECYDEEMLLSESMRFIEFYIEVLNGESISQSLKSEYILIWKHLLSITNSLNSVVVLRDYHADNLMWLEERVGIKKVGLLDFQDAVIGSPAYDLVSLLEDARRDVDQKIVDKMIQRYLNAFPEYSRKEFMAVYSILAAQRNLKIIGVFARLASVYNNKYYLTLLPRVWRNLNNDLKHPLLLSLKNWLNKVVPMQMKY